MANRKVRRPSPSRWFAEYGMYVLLVVVATVTIFLVVLAFNRPIPTGSIRQPQPTPPVPTASATPTATFAPTPDPASPTVVAFLGDSYTAGAGATIVGARWTTLLASANGWTEMNFGTERSGYSTGEFPYTARIDEVVAARPKIVFVSGGRFDFSGDSSPKTVSTAISRTFDSLRAGLPTAKVIAINPTWHSSTPPPRLREIAAEIRVAVESVGGAFVDIGQPLASEPGLVGADGVLPTDAGYAKLGASIKMTITPLVTNTN